MSQLETLIKMQSYDDRIGKKLDIKKELPKELESLFKNVETTTQNADDTKKLLDENVTGQKNKELEVKTNREKMQKYEVQQLQVKTNKEFKALNSEIAQLKTKNGKIDDEVLKLIDQENDLREDLKQAEALKAQAKKDLEQREGKLKKRLGEIDGEIDALKEERNVYARELPKSLIKRYALLIKNKNRKAVVFVENNACLGCGFKLRAQQVIEVDSQKTMVTCENCSRILVKQV